ncbi:uncharacterized protein LOC111083055 [Limulus polyphemus]|uniref:Uncharacterized protein LOC111083055 n=1 Tax=Limulus polyphemus TaxID=6850 RepID=A0ABM1RUD0_LIMPO|nr:uncharacterized protein LOC111083055 [Limulus polyphemus]
MVSETESDDHDGFPTGSLPYHNNHSNGFNDRLTEERDQYSRPSKLDPLMRNSPTTARESFNRSYLPKNKANDEQFRYHFDDLVKSQQAPQHKTQISVRIQEQMGKTETAAISGSDVTPKRGNRPSLSIVSPLDVLSQRLMLEMTRRKMKQNQYQIMANAKLLKNLGKRKALLY